MSDKRQEFRVFQGLPLVLEYLPGDVRTGKSPTTGKTWKRSMVAAYGYVRGSKGLDGDAVDIYLGTNPDSNTAYIIDQMKGPDFQVVDEQKVVLGCVSPREAKKLYLAHYPDARFFGSIVGIPMEKFKEKVMDKDLQGKKLASSADFIKKRMIAGMKKRFGELSDADIKGISDNAEKYVAGRRALKDNPKKVMFTADAEDARESLRAHIKFKKDPKPVDRSQFPEKSVPDPKKVVAPKRRSADPGTVIRPRHLEAINNATVGLGVAGTGLGVYMGRRRAKAMDQSRRQKNETRERNKKAGAVDVLANAAVGGLIGSGVGRLTGDALDRYPGQSREAGSTAGTIAGMVSGGWNRFKVLDAVRRIQHARELGGVLRGGDKASLYGRTALNTLGMFAPEVLASAAAVALGANKDKSKLKKAAARLQLKMAASRLDKEVKAGRVRYEDTLPRVQDALLREDLREFESRGKLLDPKDRSLEQKRLLRQVRNAHHTPLEAQYRSPADQRALGIRRDLNSAVVKNHFSRKGKDLGVSLSPGDTPGMTMYHPRVTPKPIVMMEQKPTQLGRIVPIAPGSEGTTSRAILMHEVGEAREFQRGKLIPHASHAGMEPILQENLHTVGDPDAQRTFGHLRRDGGDDGFIQKKLRQVGHLPDSPVQPGTRRAKALDKVVLDAVQKNPHALSVDSRDMAINLQQAGLGEVQTLPKELREHIDAGHLSDYGHQKFLGQGVYDPTTQRKGLSRIAGRAKTFVRRNPLVIPGAILGTSLLGAGGLIHAATRPLEGETKRASATTREQRIANAVDNVGLGMLAAPSAAYLTGSLLKRIPKTRSAGAALQQRVNDFHGANYHAMEMAGLGLVSPTISHGIAKRIDKALPGAEKVAFFRALAPATARLLKAEGADAAASVARAAQYSSAAAKPSVVSRIRGAVTPSSATSRLAQADAAAPQAGTVLQYNQLVRNAPTATPRPQTRNPVQTGLGQRVANPPPANAGANAPGLPQAKPGTPPLQTNPPPANVGANAPGTAAPTPTPTPTTPGRKTLFTGKNLAGAATMGTIGLGLYGGKKVVDTAASLATPHETDWSMPSPYGLPRAF